MPRPMHRLALAVAVAVGASAAAAAPPGPAVEGSWAWPVAAPHPVVRPFLAPATRYSPGHRGLDIGAPDAAVRAPADGTVHFAGVVVDRPLVSVEHAGGLLSSFEPVVPAVSEGDAVRRGDVIGTLQPGHCAAPCLHFGVRLDGEYISPLLLLGGIPRSVLLPTRADGAGPATPAAGSPGAPGSGAGVGHRVALLEPFGRHVRVDLRGAEAGVAEHLLHRPQIRSPVEQVGGRGVPQRVRARGTTAGHTLEQAGHHRVHRSGADARAAGAEEQRGAGRPRGPRG